VNKHANNFDAHGIAKVTAALVLPFLIAVGLLWPGWLQGGSKTGTAKPADPFAFVPNNCEIVIGVNVAQVLKKPGFRREFEKSLRQSMKSSEAQIELAKNLDRVVIAISDVWKSPTGVGVVTSATPLDLEKIRQAFSVGPAKEIQGKTIFKVADSSGPLVMSLPDDKTIVFGRMAEASFVKLLDGQGKLPPAVEAPVKKVSGTLLWAAIDVQAAMKGEEEKLEWLKTLPRGGETLPAIKGAKWASLYYDLAKRIRAQIDIQCATEMHAEEVEAFANNLWTTHGKPVLQILPMFPGSPLDADIMTKLAIELTENFRIQRQASKVSASVTVSESLVEELENQQAQKEK
jgi:hypothetical protein